MLNVIASIEEQNVLAQNHVSLSADVITITIELFQCNF